MLNLTSKLVNLISIEMKIIITSTYNKHKATYSTQWSSHVTQWHISGKCNCNALYAILNVLGTVNVVSTNAICWL